METWQKYLPDYQFMLWSEENSPMNHPFVSSAYAAKKYAFVADYVRFWALYNYGGVYLDTDMYVVKCFDPLLDNYFFSAWEIEPKIATTDRTISAISCGALGTCALGACALEAEVKEILNEYDKLVFDESDIEKLIVPRLITPILLKYMDKITIYPKEYFYAFPYEKRIERNFLKYQTPNSYALHLWNISWLPKSVVLKNNIIQFLKHNKYSKSMYKWLRCQKLKFLDKLTS